MHTDTACLQAQHDTSLSIVSSRYNEDGLHLCIHRYKSRTNPIHATTRLEHNIPPPPTLERIALLNERCMSKPPEAVHCLSRSPLLDLRSPSFNPFSFAPNRYIEVDMFHSLGVC